ncbi:hypothetical protein [Streptomyces sp. NBC_00557]|uniref:hypothetical protein n=1 Tax=Streptomyces sp. NBC_00557 TaxID=2975776 RepID=UPI002E80F235|nr:hypothetical protein [Streptomyces sp. NBC_00557]WUC32732.1 hypothetical protein OG956_00030 [Streptomyces sp. NBC_00557]
MAQTFTPPPADDPYGLLDRLQSIQPPAGQARSALVKQFKGDPLGELVAAAALGPEAAKHIRAKFPKTLPSGDRAELRMFQSSPIAGALVLQPRLADAEASPADPLYDQFMEAIQSGGTLQDLDDLVISAGRFSSEDGWLVLDVDSQDRLEVAVRRITDQTQERNDKRFMVATEGISDRIIMVPLMIRHGGKETRRFLTVDGISRTTAAFAILGLDPAVCAVMTQDSVGDLIRETAREVNKELRDLREEADRLRAQPNEAGGEGEASFAMRVGETAARWRALQCDVELWSPGPDVDVHRFVMEVVSLIHHQQQAHSHTSKRRTIHEAVLSDLSQVAPPALIERQRQQDRGPLRSGWDYLDWAYQAIADLIDPTWRPYIAATLRRELKISRCHAKQFSELAGAVISRPLQSLDRKHWKGNEHQQSLLEIAQRAWTRDALPKHVWNRKSRLPEYQVTDAQLKASVEAVSKAAAASQGLVNEDKRIETDDATLGDHIAFLLVVGAIATTFTGALRTDTGSGRQIEDLPEEDIPTAFTTAPVSIVLEMMHASPWGPAQLSENITRFVASFDERRRVKPRRVSAQAPYSLLDNSVADSAYIRAVAAGIEKGQAEKREQQRLRERAKQVNPVAEALGVLPTQLRLAGTSVQTLHEANLSKITCSAALIAELCEKAETVAYRLRGLKMSLQEREQKEADANLSRPEEPGEGDTP